ncbi:hypothetical protein DL771_005226 [Monosporascus sp. 5C6A]|nr:hypothetical protein DL771_005226 [Monosporascus sp. 5C6A]
MLLVMLTQEDPMLAAETVLHIWYSAFVTQYVIDVINGKPRQLVQPWTFGERSLRLVLTKDEWISLLSHFDLPTGLTYEMAKQNRVGITLAPERVGFRERGYFAQKPSSRIVNMRFREEGILLPFGRRRDAFIHPNPTIFRTIDSWLLKDHADPLDGWPIYEPQNISGFVGANDVYGKLYIYLKKLLVKFHESISARKITFKLFNSNIEELMGHIWEYRFDRVEVSDLAYIGPTNTMKDPHRIIEKWPTRLKKQPEAEGARKEFKTLLASSFSGCSAFFTYAGAAFYEDTVSSKAARLGCLNMPTAMGVLSKGPRLHLDNVIGPRTRIAVDILAPAPAKSEDGRDQWPSRATFLLAAMGGCAGQGNLLRYPSVVYNNYGLQWFVPYLIAVFIVAIPALILEISIGQAYRGGTVIAFSNIHRRLRGVGLGPVFVSFIVVHYFTVNLAWIMNYFRHSFVSPLPWEGRIVEFYRGDVVANAGPVYGCLADDSSAVASYTEYPGGALIGETVGWSAFVWFLVWVSIFRGVGLAGRVVYFTMGLPIMTTLVLVGRACSLENAREGVKLLWATWRSDQLASGTVWQTAVGQVFFWTGIGFGYFTSYASYNAKHSNAVMDAILICGSNVLFEHVAAFGVVGYLRLWPEEGVRPGAFVVGFLILPEAVLHMPGANSWAFLLFFTLVVLGFSSAFVMLDAAATLCVDSGLPYSRPAIVSALTLLSFLLCLPYCTEFGFYLLDGIDRWVNNVALIFVVWSEVVSATTVYRWTDVVDQTGLPAFAVYNFGYVGAQILGVAVAHGAGHPGYGAVTGFGLYIGNQLKRDLNVVVGGGRNWNVPIFLQVLLRYVSGPILAIIFNFAYPEFYMLRYGPMMVAGFILAHVCLLLMTVGFVMPRYYDAFIPVHRRAEGTEETVANETKGLEREVELYPRHGRRRGRSQHGEEGQDREGPRRFEVTLTRNNGKRLRYIHIYSRIMRAIPC